MTTPLLEPGFVAQLERLRLLTRRPVRGRQAGDRRSSRRGSSAEFADYRNYAPGDDFRRVDWNAYARLERLFLKLYVEEQETTLTVALDASASMDWGEPSKFRLGLQLAAALGYVALRRFDRAAVAVVGGGAAGRFGPVQGRAAVHRLWRHLAGVAPGGGVDFGAALRDLARRRPSPGVTVAISDFLMPLDVLDALASLQAAGQDLALVQVLAPDELDPELEGDLLLVDRETGEQREVAVSQGLLADYARRLAAHTSAIAGWCARRAVPFVQVPSTAPVAEVVGHALCRAGVVG